MPARPAGRQMWRVLLLLLAAAAAELLPTDPGLPLAAGPPAGGRAPAAAAGAAIAAAVGGAVVRASAVPGHFLAEMHADRPAHPAVAYVTEALAPLARTLGTRPDIPVPFAARDAAAPDWTLAVLNARAAWNVSVGAGAVVVTPDCGAGWTPPGRARVDGAHALTAVEPAATALPTPTETHGTMVASTVVAADDGVCGTGVAPGAAVVPVRLLVGGAGLSSTHIAEALVYAPTGPVAAVSNSWGPNDYAPHIFALDSVVRGALAALAARNTTLLFAAGNGAAYGDHASNDGFASSRHTLAVGALGHDGRAAAYTEAGGGARAATRTRRGAPVTVAAPLAAARPLPYGAGAFDAAVAANGTVLWAAAVLGLELRACTMAQVHAVAPPAAPGAPPPRGPRPPPLSPPAPRARRRGRGRGAGRGGGRRARGRCTSTTRAQSRSWWWPPRASSCTWSPTPIEFIPRTRARRSEERRVGKEGRSRW